MRKDGLLGTFFNPITGEKTESVGSAFVNDANMYTTGSPVDSISDILPDIDTHVYAWSKLLRVSGGCASAPKSFWYAMEQNCVDGDWRWFHTEGH